MELKIIKSKELIEPNKELKIIEKKKNLIIQANKILHNWENEVGDKFYVLGEIIGIRGSSFKINNFFDWEFLEKHENSKKIEGRYIVIKQSIKDDISIWTDFFGRVDIYWTKTPSTIEITTGIKNFSNLP